MSFILQIIFVRIELLLRPHIVLFVSINSAIKFARKTCLFLSWPGLGLAPKQWAESFKIQDLHQVSCCQSKCSNHWSLPFVVIVGKMIKRQYFYTRDSLTPSLIVFVIPKTWHNSVRMINSFVFALISHKGGSGKYWYCQNLNITSTQSKSN